MNCDEVADIVCQYRPPAWTDDQKMNVYMAPFRQRNVNPKSYDVKMAFWVESIRCEVRHHKQVAFEPKSLRQRFLRNGKLPSSSCLNEVLLHMISTGSIGAMSELEDNGILSKKTQGWVTWGLNKLIKQPITWGWNMMVKTPTTDDSLQVDKDFVILDLLQEKCVEVLETVRTSKQQQQQNDNVVGSVSSSVMFEYGTLYQLCQDIVDSEDTLNIVLKKLSTDGHVQIVDKQGLKILKFATSDKRSASPVSHGELAIFKLKKTENILREELEKLSTEIKRCLREAKSCLAKDQKSSAKVALRQKKMLERTYSKKETALETILTLLHKIHDADSDKMVLDAYSVGVETMKQKTQQEGLTVDKVEDVMMAVEQVFEDQSEITSVISRDMTMSDLDISMADLEAELDDLVASETADNLWANLDSELDHLKLADSDISLELPSVPTSDPGSWSAPRGQRNVTSTPLTSPDNTKSKSTFKTPSPTSTFSSN